MGGAFMINHFHSPQSPQEKLIELRQLEEAAKVRFDAAKNELLAIKKQIIQLQKLITPSHN